MELARSGWLRGVHPGIAIASKVVIVLFVVVGIALTDLSGATFSAVKDWALTTLRWYYIALVAFFLVFVLALLTTRYGNIRLGDDDERPEFSSFAWFAMLFSAGMGIGLVFWSIAEPIYHFQSNPFISDAQTMTPLAAEIAMRLTFFHWGLHPWAVYVIVGLSMAYFSYRKKLPLTIRSALYPVLGDRVNGVIGHLVDVLAVFATVLGVATSLGLGVQQLNAGLNQLVGLPVSALTQLVLIVLITAVATLSVVSGLNRGIKFLSVINVGLSVLMLLFLLVFGPTRELLVGLVASTGDYLSHVLPLSIWIDPDPASQWQDWWTTFYWAWWIAWAPFVGMFIARISRGRTIREFIVGVLLIPTAVGFVWLAMFGGTALYLESVGGAGIVEAVNEDVTVALYATLAQMNVPGWSLVAAVLATVLITTYFITSSDSGTLVVTTILAGGSPNPPTAQRIMWGAGEGLVAGALLLGGGLTALQSASIVGAMPFSLVMLVMVYGLVKSFREETVGPQYARIGSGAPTATGTMPAVGSLTGVRAAVPGDVSKTGEYQAIMTRLRKAAEGGDTKAQIQLGSMYESGDGVKRDLRVAVYWYKNALKQGDKTARDKLIAIRDRVRRARQSAERPAIR